MMDPSPVFTSADLGRFGCDGYVVGREIFPRNVALELSDRILDRVSDNRGEAGWKEPLILLHE